MKKTALFLSLALICLFSNSPSSFAASASADIKGTKEGSALSGKAILTDTPEGLKISLDVKNIPAGKHGFHIHENGACADEGKAAGGHYNPEGAPHGLLEKDGLTHAHAGDLGNIEVDASGSGQFEKLAKGLTLAGGKYNVAGKAFIIHEKEDDFGQPTGNAGGRIGCGVIELTQGS